MTTLFHLRFVFLLVLLFSVAVIAWFSLRRK